MTRRSTGPRVSTDMTRGRPSARSKRSGRPRRRVAFSAGYARMPVGKSWSSRNVGGSRPAMRMTCPCRLKRQAGPTPPDRANGSITTEHSGAIYDVIAARGTNDVTTPYGNAGSQRSAGPGAIARNDAVKALRCHGRALRQGLGGYPPAEPRRNRDAQVAQASLGTPTAPDRCTGPAG